MLFLMYLVINDPTSILIRAHFCPLYRVSFVNLFGPFQKCRFEREILKETKYTFEFWVQNVCLNIVALFRSSSDVFVINVPISILIRNYLPFVLFWASFAFFLVKVFWPLSKKERFAQLIT